MKTKTKAKARNAEASGEFIEIPSDAVPELMALVQRVERKMPGVFQRQELIDLLVNAALMAFTKLPPPDMRRELQKTCGNIDLKELEKVVRIFHPA